MTGLDLIHFPTLLWHQVGYSTHVLRQASGRSRRPGQSQLCKTIFLYYDHTIQAKALALMGEKESASQALEGTFSDASLRLLLNGGKDDDVLRALSKELDVNHGDPSSTWHVPVEVTVEIPKVATVPNPKPVAVVKVTAPVQVEKEDAREMTLFDLGDPEVAELVEEAVL
jgi:hypothetical protein